MMSAADSPRPFVRRWPGSVAVGLSLAAHAALLALLVGLPPRPKPVEPPDPPVIEVSWEAAAPPAEPAPTEAKTPEPEPAPASPMTTAAPAEPMVAPAPPPQPPVPPKPRRTAPARPAIRPSPAPSSAGGTDAAPTAPAPVAPAAAPPAAVPVPPLDQAEVLAAYSRLLLDRLERYKSYPAASQRRGEEATITVRLVLSGDGSLIGVSPVGEGPPRLVEASLAAVQAAAPFPPLPAAMASRQAVFTLPIVYRLR